MTKGEGWDQPYNQAIRDRNVATSLRLEAEHWYTTVIVDGQRTKLCDQIPHLLLEDARRIEDGDI